MCLRRLIIPNRVPNIVPKLRAQLQANESQNGLSFLSCILLAYWHVGRCKRLRVKLTMLVELHAPLRAIGFSLTRCTSFGLCNKGWMASKISH